MRSHDDIIELPDWKAGRLTVRVFGGRVTVPDIEKGAANTFSRQSIVERFLGDNGRAADID